MSIRLRAGVGASRAICHPSRLMNAFEDIRMATAAQLVPSLRSLDRGVAAWVDEVARLTQPERIHWCDGSAAEYQSLERELVAKKELLALNPGSFRGCPLH